MIEGPHAVPDMTADRSGCIRATRHCMPVSTTSSAQPPFQAHDRVLSVPQAAADGDGVGSQEGRHRQENGEPRCSQAGPRRSVSRGVRQGRDPLVVVVFVDDVRHWRFAELDVPRQERPSHHLSDPHVGVCRCFPLLSVSRGRAAASSRHRAAHYRHSSNGRQRADHHYVLEDDPNAPKGGLVT
jgi:hypothetical protein